MLSRNICKHQKQHLPYLPWHDMSMHALSIGCCGAPPSIAAVLHVHCSVHWHCNMEYEYTYLYPGGTIWHQWCAPGAPWVKQHLMAAPLGMVAYGLVQLLVSAGDFHSLPSIPACLWFTMPLSPHTRPYISRQSDYNP